MRAQQFYNSITSVYLETTCVSTSIPEWDALMEGAVRACKATVHRILVKNRCLTPEDVRYYNPYDYYRTDTHIIYVHSGIEHFYRINAALNIFNQVPIGPQ